MTIDRRTMLSVTAAATMLPSAALGAKGTEMYGMLGRMKAVPGKRDELLALLLESSAGMPGCLSYIVAKDATDSDAIWITEAWDSKEHHDASLKLPQVQAAIAKARPLIAGFDSRAETEPVGGIGLKS
ncbi:putative quinol monooxygenase [Sphingomonas sp.]|uniref:putative quinol monooxygenase n=1 Tax=Sphingomonas sp. TaxID=28214 RepID=UPI0025E59943|nr:putative quinol monooxygenase [Sphingomonas sp.]